MAPFILSKSKIWVPRIIYGTAWKKADTQRLVNLAIQNGFRGIDTACQPKHYDEAGVGAGIAASLKQGLTRADLYLQTKFTSLSGQEDRKSTRLNSSHQIISYAVFCLKKKKKHTNSKHY